MTSPQLPLLNTAVVITTQSALRAEPAHRSEMVSELIFGDRVVIYETVKDTWAYIETEFDHYKGYCLLNQLKHVNSKQFAKPISKIAGHNGGSLRGKDWQMPIPTGADLSLLRKGVLFSDVAAHHYYGHQVAIKDIQIAEDLPLIAQSFLHAPYLWGGRTRNGIDCSGLVQMCYRTIGVSILRDATQQATMGTDVYFVKELKMGDLVFFDNEQGHINHVGMMLNATDIIHSSEQNGMVAIDKLDAEGIISRKLKKRTHRIRLMKRVLK